MFQFLYFLGVQSHNFFYFPLIDVVVLVEAFLQFSDNFVLGFDLVDEGLFFLFVLVVGIVQSGDHFLDFVLVSFNFEEGFVDVILFPFKKFLIPDILIG